MRFSAALGLTLPLVLSLSALTPVLGEKTAQQIVSDAGRLLTEGSYVEAARAYGEAIGMLSCMASLFCYFIFASPFICSRALQWH